MAWIGKVLEKAGWRAFAIWFAVWFAYTWRALNMEGPWTRALAAGGGTLPEAQFGFPAEEPGRSLALLGSATGDYLLWQGLDIPYALLNLTITSIAIAIGLKAVRLDATPLRFFLLLPPLYVLSELVENALVASFAATLLPVSDPLTLLQQAATSVKLLSGYASMWLGVLGLIVGLIAAIVGAVAKR